MGVPHIMASARRDAYVGLGYAMGEDRLWQLDWTRKRAQGRSAEFLGPAHVRADMEARLVGFVKLAEENLLRLAPATVDILEAFSSGVNLALERQRADLPPEFQTLGYEPELWCPLDTLAILKAFWWQLSGRLYWLAEQDHILRALPAPLVEAFLAPSGDVGAIVDPATSVDSPATAGADDGTGSNNWVVSGRLTRSGSPLLASDPHVALLAPSVWYEARLDSPEEASAGICYAGAPGFLIGRNVSVAWGFTNNICSIRDLYREQLDPTDPSRYAADAPEHWQSFNTHLERIAVRGDDDQELTVQSTIRGPIVNALLDERVRPPEPVSLVWTGTEPSDEIGVMLRYQTARDVDGFRAALADWVCPTFNYVFADGRRIGYQCVGAIPWRGRRWPGIRYAQREDDRWRSVRQTASLPGMIEPAQGWIVTANNRVATTDETINQSGYWPSSLRAERISELLDGGSPHDAAEMKRLQLDVRSLRGHRLAPVLLGHLSEHHLSGLASQAARELAAWDGEFSVESVGATVFETFMLRWTNRVVNERFPPQMRDVAVPHAHGFASRLLRDDVVGWFGTRSVSATAENIFEDVVSELATRLGPEVGRWGWGRLHQVALHHALDGETTVDWPFPVDAEPIDGGWNTVNNELYDPKRPFTVTVGASHRIIADLGSGSLLSASSSGASGDPRKGHYRDGFDEWRRGGYHELWLHEDTLKAENTAMTLLKPDGDSEGRSTVPG
jgi:penicillin amidase